MEINLQIVKVSSEKTETQIKQMRNSLIFRFRKRKKEMEIIEFLVIRGQLSFNE